MSDIRLITAQWICYDSRKRANLCFDSQCIHVPFVIYSDVSIPYRSFKKALVLGKRLTEVAPVPLKAGALSQYGVVLVRRSCRQSYT